MIPAHGPGPFLAEAVASALAEEPAEVLVVEDGTEGVDEAALGGARLVRLPHVRRSRARNTGVEAARTPFVAFLDEDDLCLPGRLERQRAAIGDAALCFGQVEVSGHDDAAAAGLLARRFARLAAGPPTPERVLASDCPIYTSATLVRREAFLAAGGYDPSFDAYEDLDLYLRLAATGGLVPCPGKPVTVYRRHEGNTSSEALYRGMLGVTAKHLPGARGRTRRLLLERRVNALWGLGDFRKARREALVASLREPGLLVHPRFLKRLAGLALPLRLLEARR